MEEVPYFDLLMNLADYQHKLGTPIRFQFQVETEATQHSSVHIHPAPEEVQAHHFLGTEFTYPSLEPIQAWDQSGLILILNGRPSSGEGIFLLTSRAIVLASARLV